MNTQFITKPFEKKHRTATIWRGSTLLALVGLLIPVWQQHEDNKALSSRNTALWTRIQAQEQEITDLRTKEAYLEGQVTILNQNGRPSNSKPLPSGEGWSVPN